MSAMAFTFTKSERLCHKKLIARLFEKGNRGLSRFPFRFTWAEARHDGPFPVQILFVVPKKHFPRAVMRNRVKRQLRELYRLRKHELYDFLEPLNRKFILSLSIISRTELKHAEAAPLFEQLFDQLKHEMAKAAPASLHRDDQAV